MSKPIRVDDGVYIALQALQEPRETYSHVVERLIKVYVTIKDVSDTLGTGHYLKGRPIVDVRQEEDFDRRGDSRKVPYVLPG